MGYASRLSPHLNPPWTIPEYPDTPRYSSLGP